MSTLSGNTTYVHAKVLRINVGFLLAESVGFSTEMEFNVPSPLRVADDLLLNHFYATVRLSHTRDGILVQGDVQTSVPDECSRCMDPILLPVEFAIEELFGSNANAGAEFRIGDDNILDLAPLIREEAMLNIPMVVPIGPDGRCMLCNRSLKEVLMDNGLNSEIDPRFQALIALRNAQKDAE